MDQLRQETGLVLGRREVVRLGKYPDSRWLQCVNAALSLLVQSIVDRDSLQDTLAVTVGVDTSAIARLTVGRRNVYQIERQDGHTSPRR